MRIEKDAFLARVLKRSEFIEACSVVASEGNQINFAETNFVQRDESCSASWNITRHDGSTDVEHHKLAVDFDGKTFVAYFDDMNCHYVELSEAQRKEIGSSALIWPPKWWPGQWNAKAAGAFCWGGWSSWVTVSTNCGYNFWCPFHGKKAVYVTQSRYCIKNPHNKQTKKWKLHCGC